MALDQTIRVKLPTGGMLVLDGGNRWRAEGKVRPGDIERAQEVTDDYRYSPADGYPGFALAEMVAKALGGQAILFEPPPIPKGAIP